MKKLSKPNFSKTPGCWEIDIMFAKYYSEESENKQFIRKQTIYVVLSNVNTRYLIVLPVEDKTQQSYINAIKNHFKNKLIDTGKYKQWTGPKGGEYKKVKPDNERV